MLLVYSPTKSSRLEYILTTLLDAAGTPHRLTVDLQEFHWYDGAKINYSANKVSEEEIWISPVELLFQQEIIEQPITCFSWNETKAFFAAPGDIPFDIFAASFYLLTRYEEYLPHHLDEYGRYAYDNSIAFKEGFLQWPVVNIWLKKFVQLLQEKFPVLVFQSSTFSFIPTYDIDIAWSYKNKGLIRNIGGAFKSLLQGEWSGIRERVNVLSGIQQDPFNVYDWLDELHGKYKLDPYYFFLLAEKNKGYDKNIPPGNRDLKQLIQEISSEYEVGIHPSWQSGDDVALLNREVAGLKAIIQKQVDSSRQHYIRMTLPGTYRHLTNAGIRKDFSMGYGSINGFRASYCLPFQWYDLEDEKVTGLTIYPFCFMEANSYYEQRYTLQQAAEELDHYYRTVKDLNGVLITIFHNHILGNKQLFEGWKEMYEHFLEKANEEQLLVE